MGNDDFDVMIEKLGPKGAAEGLLKGYAYWKQNKGKEAANIREEPITVKEWKERLADDGFGDEDEADDDDDDEDDAGNGEGEEEEEEHGDDEDYVELEPATKRKET